MLWRGQKRSRIVMLDEPTAVLGIEQLRSRNIAVVFISHNMQHVIRVADRVCVPRRRHRGRGPRTQVRDQQG